MSEVPDGKAPLPALFRAKPLKTSSATFGHSGSADLLTERMEGVIPLFPLRFRV